MEDLRPTNQTTSSEYTIDDSPTDTGPVSLDSPRSVIAKAKAHLKAPANKTGQDKVELSLELIAVSGDVMYFPIARENAAKSLERKVREQLKELSERYPEISISREVFRGKPHIKGTRFTVADVLTALYADGSIANVLDEYEHSFTEEQMKEAILFARDFLLSIINRTRV